MSLGEALSWQQVSAQMSTLGQLASDWAPLVYLLNLYPNGSEHACSSRDHFEELRCD